MPHWNSANHKVVKVDCSRLKFISSEGYVLHATISVFGFFALYGATDADMLVYYSFLIFELRRKGFIVSCLAYRYLVH